MGYYIDPKNESKEDWLNRNGHLVEPAWPPLNDEVLVCIINNRGSGIGEWSAAGVVYNEREFQRFAAPDHTDGIGERRDPSGTHVFTLSPTKQRPRTWYAVPKTVLFADFPWMASVFE